MNENVVLNEQDILALPFVPLRGIVVYPKLVSHIDIGRDTSLLPSTTPWNTTGSSW